MYGVEVFIEALCLIDVGELVLKGKSLELALQLLRFYLSLAALVGIPGVKCNGKIEQVQEVAAGKVGVLYAPVRRL